MRWARSCANVAPPPQVRGLEGAELIRSVPGEEAAVLVRPAHRLASARAGGRADGDIVSEEVRVFFQARLLAQTHRCRQDTILAGIAIEEHGYRPAGRVLRQAPQMPPDVRAWGLGVGLAEGLLGPGCVVRQTRHAIAEVSSHPADIVLGLVPGGGEHRERQHEPAHYPRGGAQRRRRRRGPCGRRTDTPGGPRGHASGKSAQ
mmetsp:Transcript_137208/g.438781  ORF Transcript_137208/g.438781 Transcript_137208/m.438781 type:complete len:203 (+) Transcript_137208:853-1461(+)